MGSTVRSTGPSPSCPGLWGRQAWTTGAWTTQREAGKSIDRSAHLGLRPRAQLRPEQQEDYISQNPPLLRRASHWEI